MPTPSVSVIILTHNRPKLFKQCFNSIIAQLTFKDEVIIINNNSTHETTKFIKQLIYKKAVSYIKYINNPTNSIPLARNIGIKKTQKSSSIIAFIDDDCIADKNWLKQIKKSHLNHPQVFAVQGSTQSIPKNNFYTHLTSLFYQNWINSIKKNKHALSTFDTKNLSFKKSLWNKFKFKFDQKLLRSSDINLGLKITNQNLIILYNKNIKVFHKERVSLLGFLHQHFLFAKGEGQQQALNLISKRHFSHISTLKSLIKKLWNKQQYFKIIQLSIALLGLFVIRLAFFCYYRCLSLTKKTFR